MIMPDNGELFIFLYNKKAKRNKIQRKIVLCFSYSCFCIGGLKAECEPLPIIDGL